MQRLRKNSLSKKELGTNWQGLSEGCKDKKEKAAVGFEPTDNGFANRRLRPLGYAANFLFFKMLEISE